MRVVSLILILLFVSSCASSSKKKSLSVGTSLKDADWIEEADFKELKELGYNEKDDYFVVEDTRSSVLAKETLDRLGKPKLDISSSKGLDEALSLCYRGDLDEALRTLDKLYKTYKSNPSFWNVYGSCYLLHGNDKMALLFYNKAKNLDKNYIPALNNLGIIYLKQGQDQKALETFKEALRRKGTSNTPLFNYSFLQLRYGLHQQACPNFQKFYLQSPKDIDVLNALGTCELLSNNSSKAIEFYKSIDGDYLERPDIGLNYAVALKVLGKRDEAMDAFEDIDENLIKKDREYYLTVKEFIQRN